MALLGRLAVPSAGFGVIDASKVHLSEGELRVGVTLLGGQAEPPHGISGVLRHALADGVHPPEGELRGGVARLGFGAQVGEFLCC